MAIERLLTGNIGSQVKELMATEDIVIEAVRDLVKDEIKASFEKSMRMKNKRRIKGCYFYYFNAKARSVYAELKASRAAADWDCVRQMTYRVKLAKLGGLFEKELGNLLEKAL